MVAVVILQYSSTGCSSSGTSTGSSSSGGGLHIGPPGHTSLNPYHQTLPLNTCAYPRPPNPCP